MAINTKNRILLFRSLFEKIDEYENGNLKVDSSQANYLRLKLICQAEIDQNRNLKYSYVPYLRSFALSYRLTDIQRIKDSPKIYKNQTWLDNFPHPNNFLHSNFKSLFQNVFQCYNEIEIYPDISDKAIALFYYLIKGNYLPNGNKKYACLMLDWFLSIHLVEYAINKEVLDGLLVLVAFVHESQAEDKSVVLDFCKQVLMDNSKF